LDLDEWMWRNNYTSLKLGKLLDISQTSMVWIRRKRNSCGLLTAIKIHTFTNGEVPFEELLKDSDRDKYIKWFANHRKSLEKLTMNKK